MEQGKTEAFIVDQASKMGQPIPEAIKNAPQLLPGLEFYFKAFFELSTCRSIGMDIGPVPYTAISEYANRHGMNNDVFPILLTFIRGMDNAYIKWQESKRK